MGDLRPRSSYKYNSMQMRLLSILIVCQPQLQTLVPKIDKINQCLRVPTGSRSKPTNAKEAWVVRFATCFRLQMDLQGHHTFWSTLSYLLLPAGHYKGRFKGRGMDTVRLAATTRFSPNLRLWSTHNSSSR